ncbi:hypothetical protein C9374_011480 [Naegleria lovaniensis]|uniref:fructokinase n=1 Tax=Naegleria lovaniensis TaxID=51637 RepID=A0AA88KWR7_NAELO|nr:uncharacterized protein C9374_011480 [Naegleria lovaniensis]KAG2392755.1 hypothetical protein C9374_011480 [Naegleria lovaniensis]
MSSVKLIVGVEGGGTSFKVAIGTNVHDAMNHVVVVETKSVEETMQPIKEFLERKSKELGGEIARIGIANFGPIDVKAGCILPSTPKVSWRGFNIVDYFKKAFPNVESIHFDTDVNGPAMAEYQQMISGNTAYVKSLAYVTIGTGIGVGLVVNGSTVSGLMHPEGGHIYTPVHPTDMQNGFQGFCTFHKQCLEGMAASPAIVMRKNISIHDVKDLSDDDEVWDIEAHYLAHLCTSLILISSCQVIVLGGGIMNRKILFDKIREKTVQLLNGYHVMVNNESIRGIIKPSLFGEHAGIKGALYLATQ